MDGERPTVFISHPGEAAVYATQAKEVFESYGFTGWVFDQDRAARGDLDEDVAAAVQRCDYFAHICADGTAASDGQRDERRYAKACGKFPPVLLVFDEAYVPLVYARLYFDHVSPEAFVADCRLAVERLQREQKLSSRSENKDEEALLELAPVQGTSTATVRFDR